MSDSTKAKPMSEPVVARQTVVVAESGEGPLQQMLLDGRHRLIADEPLSQGGDDAGPNPYELLLMSLGACTSMTLRLYARRKQWPLERIIVRLRHGRIHAEDCADCETKSGMIDRIECEIELLGALEQEQRARLRQIADLCPVHRTLTSEINIVTRLAESGPSSGA
jgi:putative redox protein